jgi:DNA-binding FadR family transcriptional regulator
MLRVPGMLGQALIGRSGTKGGSCQLGYATGVGEVMDRVESALRAIIVDGGLKAGDPLPSERELVRQLGAGRTTIRTALQKLTIQGVIEPQHGRGYFVCQQTGRRRS